MKWCELPPRSKILLQQSKGENHACAANDTTYRAVGINVVLPEI
jgi:hypothetical protein